MRHHIWVMSLQWGCCVGSLPIPGMPPKAPGWHTGRTWQPQNVYMIQQTTIRKLTTQVHLTVLLTSSNLWNAAKNSKLVEEKMSEPEKKWTSAV